MDKTRLLPALFVVFTNLLGATIIIPILPLFAVDQFGGSVMQVVLLDTSYYAAKLVATPILGYLSDKYGRRPLLLISQLGTTVSFLLFLTALPFGQWLDQTEKLPIISGGLLILYLARIMDGFTGGNTAIAQAYVSDITKPEARTQALGYLSAALGIGFILGPAVGGVLAAVFGILAPFIFGAVMAGLGVLLTYFLLIESLPPDQQRSPQSKPISSKKIAYSTHLWRLFSIGFLTTVCFAAISPTFSLYAKVVMYPDVQDTAVVGRNVGFIFMLVGLVMAVTQGGLLKPIIHRLGERRALLLAQALLLLAFFTLPQSNQPFWVALWLIPLAFGYSVAEPSLQSLISTAGDKQTIGHRLGSYQSGLSLAYIISPLWAGYVFQTIQPQALWLIGGVILIPSLVLTLLIQRKSASPQTTPEGLG